MTHRIAPRRTRDGRPMYADPLQEVTDQIGVRVITYVHSDVAAVAQECFDASPAGIARA